MPREVDICKAIHLSRIIRQTYILTLKKKKKRRRNQDVSSIREFQGQK